MSHIRSKDTTIEVKLRKALWKRGFRYRKNYASLPGKPDIALTKYKVAVFCDSDFFHGNPVLQIPVFPTAVDFSAAVLLWL